MNMAFDSKSVAREHLSAAIHPYDGTLRPQILDQRTNPFLYKILKIYERRTKRGGLLNTSFNVHGEPIVCTPEDALSTLKRSGLKCLVINDFLIRKV
jgi:carbamoyltransferase